MNEETKNPYARLLSWEVWNFMAIKNGKCDFDERNIINLKGYNDSGKSAMLTALKVLCTNFRPNKQVDFIQDDEDYFRIIATFEGGIQILRDKYINGQSLYEMYKDGKCIFTTKSDSGQLTKVADVPKPIADFLGLISYDDTYLNFRSCFEEQLGVQTKGSENYKMFNTVLKSEEISSANDLLNTDRNKLASDINAVDAEIVANKGVLGVGQCLTEDMINYLLVHDKVLTVCETSLDDLNRIKSTSDSIDSIRINPEIQVLDEHSLNDIIEIKDILNSLSSIVVCPELQNIDTSQLDFIEKVQSSIADLNKIVEYPEVGVVNSGQIDLLSSISSVIKEMTDLDAVVQRDDELMSKIAEEVSELESQLIDLGVKMVKCPNCGTLFSADEQHQH